MRFFLKISLLTCISFLANLSFGQDKADSIRKELEKATSDTVKVNLLLDLSKALYGTQPEEARKYATQAKEIATEANYGYGVGYALKNIGLAYYVQGNYPEVLVNWNESLKVFTEIGDKLGEANILNNIGAVYYDRGDYVKALDNYLKSLELSENLGDTVRIATALMNIGAVYQNNPTTYDKALEKFEQALQMFERTGNMEGIGSASGNIGQLLIKSDKFDEALKSFQQSLSAYQKLGMSHNLPFTLSYIGLAHSSKGNHSLGIKYQKEAIGIASQYGYKLELVRALTALAGTYELSGDHTQAIESYRHAEKLAKEIEAKFEQQGIYEKLVGIFSHQGDYKNAFLYQRYRMAIKDSLFTDNNAKRLERLQFEFDLGKKESQISLLTKDAELQKLEFEKQKFTQNALIAGFILLLLLAFILLKNYQIKVKANRMLAKQNVEISQQKEEIESQRDDIESQKKEIETLILNILPVEVAHELRKTGKATPRYYENVSILFTDFKEFSKMADTVSAQQLVEELNECFVAFDQIIEENGLEKIKTIGDAYMCACGIPTPVEDSALRTVRAGLAIQHYIIDYNEKRIARGLSPWELRIGIHTGPVIAGVVGKKKFAYDIWGNAVNIAARLEANGEEGKVNISEATFQLIKENYECYYRGKIKAKNIGDVDMYFVEREIRKEPVTV
jgi:adenylate cyclase